MNSKLRKVGGGLFVSMLAIVVTLGVVELAAYVIEIQMGKGPDGWTLVGSRRLDLVEHGDTGQPYYLFEPNNRYRWEGIDVSINSYGVRGPEFNEAKDPSTYRILNLGDSIPFGWEVEFEETYGYKLRSLLSQSSPDVEWDLITVAVPGWTPAMALNYFRDQGVHLSPDTVILAITLVNDVYGSGPDVAKAGSLTDWLRDHTYSWPVFTTQARLVLERLAGPQFMPVLHPPTNPQAYYPQDAQNLEWERLLGPVRAIRRVCDENGIDFVVIIFPTAMQLNEQDHPSLPQAIIDELVHTTSGKFVNLLPAYQDECERAGPGACIGLVNDLFADVWMHPNARGHELAAEVLLGTITPNADLTR